MAHNSRRNRRDVTTHDDDEYIYPTAKVRETKTRDRRSSRNLIQKGLVDLENSSFDEFEDEGAYDGWHNDTPEASEEDIEAFYNKVEEQKRIENEEGGYSDAVFEFKDVNTDWGHRWEEDY